MIEEFNNEELFEGVELTADSNDLPVIETEVAEEAPVAEEVAPVEEAPKPAPKKKAKKTAPKVEKKAPGKYYQGKLITAIPARLGRKWTVVIDGKRQKVLKKDIEIVK